MASYRIIEEATVFRQSARFERKQMELHGMYVLSRWQLYFVLTSLNEVLLIVKHQEMFHLLLNIHKIQINHIIESTRLE